LRKASPVGKQSPRSTYRVAAWNSCWLVAGFGGQARDEAIITFWGAAGVVGQATATGWDAHEGGFGPPGLKQRWGHV
jgi:hypothetical protein